MAETRDASSGAATTEEVVAIMAPSAFCEPKKNVPVEHCFWVLARGNNNTYMCKSCGGKKTCSSSRALRHLIGPPSGWGLCPSPRPEYISYLTSVMESRESRREMSGVLKGKMAPPAAAAAPQATRPTGGKRSRDTDGAASDDSADTARQGTDGLPASPPAQRRRKASRPQGGAVAKAGSAAHALPNAPDAPLMMSAERAKMIAGELYNPGEGGLAEDRARARDLMTVYNCTTEREKRRRNSSLRLLLPNAPGITVQAPFYCDYGYNITTGTDVFMNFNCVILDVCPVTIGSRTMFGPSVQVYTATHPVNAKERSSGLELGKPIVIGDDVWVGGAAVICPGVTIGDKSIIGAGSVVTKDIPPNVLAVGNPCKVVRELTENDISDAHSVRVVKL